MASSPGKMTGTVSPPSLSIPVSTSTITLPDLDFPSTLVGKRILLATESLGPVNGVSRTTQNLITYLRINGVHVAVVAPEGPGMTTRITDPNAPEIRLTGYPLPMDPSLSVVYPFRLNRLCRRTRAPDLIYLASPASLGFQILLQLRSLSRPPPVLCNFQTDLSAYCEILFPTPLDAWAVWVFRSVQGYLFSHPAVRTVFYPSFGVRAYLERAGVQPSKLLNLRRGVNTDLFTPTRRNALSRKTLTPNNELLLLSVSRLAPEKGFAFLAATATALVASGLPFHLLIVGGNRNPSVEASIRALFAPISSFVTFTGLLEGEALATAYASADIFLHSSITETFGLVVLEAMASGLPVIARAEGGPTEIVLHGETGFLVPADDSAGFLARINELSGDSALRASMSIAARNRSLEATWEKINHRVACQLAATLQSEGRSELKLSSIRVSVEVLLIYLIWAGLVITWGLAMAVMLLKTGVEGPWRLLAGGVRSWRAGRLRTRAGGDGHASRRI